GDALGTLSYTPEGTMSVALMRQRREHPIEHVGKALRDRMSWLAPQAKAPERAAVAESRTQAA
ncbi:MAG: hypothetical protein ACPGJE_00430, partial [Wenzhouxiangellaceae bacterium]